MNKFVAMLKDDVSVITVMVDYDGALNSLALPHTSTCGCHA